MKENLPLNQQPPDLTQLLRNSLAGAKKVAILGIGSELRGDDVSGMLIAEKLEKKFKKNSTIKIFYGGTAPENLTGELRKFEPSHVIMVDSADTSAEPGTISYIDPEIVGGVSFSTHMMPIKIMIDFLAQDLKCKSVIVGIQPKSIHFGVKPSREVLKSVNEVSSSIMKALKPF
jgi:hydrogenase 3 maturation protease